VLHLLRAVLPSRLAERWVELHTAQPDGNGAGRPDWTNAGIARLEEMLHRWVIRPAGTEGFIKAEVTVGGVDTRELDARSMQSRRAAGLYFVGEVVDVTGWLGGYNFQWAWSSAAAAAEFA
jgi:predicted flavoprotein YhiN